MVAAESDKDVAGMLRPLEFNEQAHQILCSELKHLYTAVTRARVRVVIYDEDQAKRAPLFYYLEKCQLCNVSEKDSGVQISRYWVRVRGFREAGLGEQSSMG